MKALRDLGITPKLTLVFVLFAAMLLVGVSLLAYSSGRAALEAATVSELLSTAIEKEAALSDWVAERISDVATVATLPHLLHELEVLTATSAGALAAAQTAHDQVVQELQPFVGEGRGFSELLVLEPETGKVIVATEPREEGKFKADRPYFINGRKGAYVQNVYDSLALQGPAMTVSAPLRSADGKLLGVLAGRLNMDEMNAIISRRTGLRQTDDAFLVNTSGLFVTQPREVTDRAVLQRGIHTEHVRLCVADNSGVVSADDYRGVPVIAVYRWMPERELCLIVKIDQAEAFGPSRAFGQTILLVSVAALIIASVTAVGLAGSIVRPLQSLQAGVVRFGRGELSTRLPETSGDELGVLAHEFNKMAEALAEEQTFLRSRAEQFFNLALDMLCTASVNGHLADLNPAWEQTLGYSREELRARPLIDFVHPDDVAATIAALQRISQDSVTVHFENRCRHKDGSYRWLAWAVVTSPQDQLLYAAAHDVTERRLTEETLRQQAEDLVRSNRELEQFAYVASHDLQEPLRIVSSYVQLLARRYQGKLDSEADEFIAFAVEGANRMKTLVNDLLAFSRVGTRGKDFAPVAMDEIFDRAVSNLQLAIEESGTTVTHDSLPSVLADDVQMTQLLQNLIGNAIKFRSKERPRVHVGVRRQGQQWLFFVRDNGVGIDPQYNERIFIIFQRLHARDEYSGTGIGLAICRKIVERHGGRIWVESEPGKGATFYFTLRPVESVTSETEAAPPEGAKPRAKDTVAERATDLV